MQSVGRTHVGLHRAANEDSILLMPGVGLFAVADGMGGHRGGRVASHMVTGELIRIATELGRALDGEELAEALEEINRKVHQTGQESAELFNMGSTCVAISVMGGRVHLAYLGDSRAYLIRAGEIQQLTSDHRVIQPMLDRGEITEDEARTHPMRNVLTRSVGVEADVEVSRVEVPIDHGDRILLCSDGLSDLVPPELLLEKVLGHAHLEDLASALVDSANAAGGHDNISVVVVQIGTETDGA
jgi:protein phosphatase